MFFWCYYVYSCFFVQFSLNGIICFAGVLSCIQIVNFYVFLSNWYYIVHVLIMLFRVFRSSFAVILPSVFCFRNVVLSVSEVLFCLFQKCCFVCFGSVVLSVSKVLFCLFWKCCFVCFRSVVLSVSEVLFCLFQKCCFVCFRSVVLSLIIVVVCINISIVINVLCCLSRS
jgi:hypothetical protein